MINQLSENAMEHMTDNSQCKSNSDMKEKHFEQ